jgi:hypothetical protein
MNHEDVVWMVSDEKENVTNDSTALGQKLHITIRDYLPNISISDNFQVSGDLTCSPFVKYPRYFSTSCCTENPPFSSGRLIIFMPPNRGSGDVAENRAANSPSVVKLTMIETLRELSCSIPRDVMFRR